MFVSQARIHLPLHMITPFTHPPQVYFRIRAHRSTSNALGPPIHQSIEWLTHPITPLISLSPFPDLLGVGDRRGHRVRALAEPRHGHGLRLRHHAHPPRRLQDLPHGMSVTVMRQYVRSSLN